MNILLSSCTHWWNAEAAYAAEAGRALADAGHQVWVLAQPGTRNWAQLEARGLNLLGDIPLWSSHPLQLRAAMATLRRFQSQQAIQVVNVFRSRELPWHLWATRGAGLGQQGAAVVRTLGSATPVKGHWLNRRLHRRVGLIASAHVVRGQGAAALRREPATVPVIHYPIAAGPLLPTAERLSAREALLREFGWPTDARVLMMVGRTAPEKGHPLLFRALQLLRETLPQARLLVVDKPTPGRPEYTAELHQMAREMGLGTHMAWAGWRDDLPRLMQAVDVGLITSVASEVNCRVAVEFMAAAVPVVATPTGALPEVVTHGETGWISADHTPEQMAELLGRVLPDTAACEGAGQHARAATEGRFSHGTFAAHTLAAYEDALRRTGGA